MVIFCKIDFYDNPKSDLGNDQARNIGDDWRLPANRCLAGKVSSTYIAIKLRAKS